MITLDPGAVTLTTLNTIYTTEGSARLNRSCDAAIAQSSERVSEIAIGAEPVYGVNTGFGKLASVRIETKDVAALQRNLIRSHCCGIGMPFAEPIVRLIMVLKLISLGRGASGVRLEVVRLLEAMLRRGVIPVIPEQGSVGASGDLAPLAHLAAVMMGEGEAFLSGGRIPAAQALSRAGLEPLALAPKEGLALVNGTQVSTALALVALFQARLAARTALVTGALSTDALMGSTAPFHPEIQALRGHRGQADAARALSALLDGSEIRASHLTGDSRVQDPYCIRCQPQVAGACLDLLDSVARTLEIEANAATDNPLILSDGSVVSGGNFHAEPVAFAADIIALAICELGAISQRRIATMVDPAMSHGLPAFLASEPGLHSGLIVAEVASAALMAENKQMAHPASVDSTPTCANQEDHVSMACHGARRLAAMTRNLHAILAIEAICGAQAIDFRSPLQTSPQLAKVVALIRAQVAFLDRDRHLAGDLERATALVARGDIAHAVPSAILPPLTTTHAR